MPSGAWRAQTRVSGSDTLNTRAWGRDEQHRDPDPNPGVRHNSWDAAEGMSATPTGLATVQDSWSLDESRAVQLDQTPQDHHEGMGAGPGLSTTESMAVNAAVRSVDQGATRARRFASPYRDDGVYRANRTAEPEFQAGSPESLRFQMQSAPDISPNARMGYRIARFMDRVFGTMRWEPDHRPLYITNAYSGRDVPAATGGAAASSPFSSLARVVRIDPARPQLRRSPPSWDEAQMEDAQASPADVHGFQSWGL